jgi:hypothetical protein
MTPVALTPSSVVADAFRREHDHLHAEFMAHWRRCRRACVSGGVCPIGRRLADAADAAGTRWQIAEERGMGRP